MFCVFFLRKVIFFCKVFFLTALFLYFASGFDCFARCFVLFCSVLFCSRKKCLFSFFSCAYDFFCMKFCCKFFLQRVLFCFLQGFFCFAMGFVLFSCFAIFLQRLIFCFFAKFFFFAKCCFRKCFRYFLQVFVFGKVMYSLRLFFLQVFFFSFFATECCFFNGFCVVFWKFFFWPGALFFWNGFLCLCVARCIASVSFCKIFFRSGVLFLIATGCCFFFFQWIFF